MAIQDKFNKTNVIYKITKDIDLAGGTLNIPNDCTLDFLGGKFSNGTLTGTFFIKADRKIFDSITTTSALVLRLEVDPKWFGVMGDKTTDDTDAIKAMLLFCKNISYTPVNFRNPVNEAPRIKFDSRLVYKITSPITINFLCNILGNPTFLYSGTLVADGAAIVIDKQYNTTFEFSVARTLSSTVDLSSGVLFSAVKTMNCVWCNFNIHQIYGFNTGIYMLCNGNSNTLQCTFNVHNISYCINGFIVNTISSGWSNGNKIIGTKFIGLTSGLTLPTGLTNGTFLKFIGDGTYAANSWVLKDISVETKLNNSTPIYFILIKMSTPLNDAHTFKDFSISNIRLENIGLYFLESDSMFVNCLLNYLYIDTAISAKLTKFNTTVSIKNKVAKVFGIHTLNSVIEYSSHFNFLEALQELRNCNTYMNISDKIKLCSKDSTESNQASTINSFGTPSPIYKIAPGEVISFYTSSISRVIIAFYNEALKRILTPTDIVFYNSYYTKIAYNGTDYLLAVTDSVKNGFLINNGTTTYRFAILVQSDYDIYSSVDISTEDIIGYLKLVGTTANRPVLNSNYVGYTYYDTDVKLLLVWNGTAWQGSAVMMKGTTPEILALIDTLTADLVGFMAYNTLNNMVYVWDGTTFKKTDGNPTVNAGTTDERPLIANDGYIYYDRTINKWIIRTGSGWLELSNVTA